MIQSILDRFEPLLKIICCPYTKTPLVLLTLPELEESLLEAEQSRIPSGTIGALVSTASSKAYPIIGPVISFLEHDTLRLSKNANTLLTPDSSPAASIKLGVKKWYDEFGWKQTEAGLYGDTVLFSQVGHSAHGFYEMHSHLSLLECFLGGEFLLDAASGAIPHPEYLAYSWFYKYRVCVDISLVALQEAASKVGDKGFYCMADICRLPFYNNAFDGVVSAYTIQHIPESDQRQALAELYRQPSRGLIRSALVKAIRLIGRIIQASDGGLQANGKTLAPPAPTTLYAHIRDLAWWRETLSEIDCEFSLRALRLLSKGEFERLFDNSLAMAKFLRALEISLPQLLSGFCRYGLIEFSKKSDQ